MMAVIAGATWTGQSAATCGDMRAIYEAGNCCGAPKQALNYTVLPSCDAASVELSQFKQWNDETGYWLGELSLYDENGDPSTSPSWNYKYDHYRSFITGNVSGGAYRQRNIFMYPPQSDSVCKTNNATVGAGVCSVNGNMKLFEADQWATKCNASTPGAIEGPYGSMQYTYTTLIGHDNAVHYMVYLTAAALNMYVGAILGNPGGACKKLSDYVWDCGYTEDRLMQSQLTTLSQKADGTKFRVRTAQGFDAFASFGHTYASYYRETQVTKQEFYTRLNATLKEYQILESDYAQWKSGETGGTVSTGKPATWQSMHAHLEESFHLDNAHSRVERVEPVVEVQGAEPSVAAEEGCKMESSSSTSSHQEGVNMKTGDFVLMCVIGAVTIVSLVVVFYEWRIRKLKKTMSQSEGKGGDKNSNSVKQEDESSPHSPESMGC